MCIKGVKPYQPFTTCDTSSPGASRPRPTLASAAAAAAAASAGGGAIPGSQSGAVAADSAGGAPSSTPRREQLRRGPGGPRRGGSIRFRRPWAPPPGPVVTFSPRLYHSALR